MVTLGILVSFKGSLGVTSWHFDVVLRVGNLFGLFSSFFVTGGTLVSF